MIAATARTNIHLRDIIAVVVVVVGLKARSVCTIEQPSIMDLIYANVQQHD